MLQLRYESGSSATTSTAVWSSEAVAPGITGVTVDLTASFSNNTSSYSADISSNKTYPSGGWIIFQTPKGLIPSSSGQYDASVFLFVSGGISDIWSQADVKWAEADFTWIGTEEYGTAITTTERAIISGSDYSDIYKYEFEDESIFHVYDN